MDAQLPYWSRRDFLKLLPMALAGSLPGGFAPEPSGQVSGPNVIIILMDALSARHMSLYGYVRDTTPHMRKFSERAATFTNHYSAGNFTTPGTASLLTGMYPWTHRAFNQGGLIKRELLGSNFYSLLGDRFHRFAFAQNPYPDRILSQFLGDIDDFPPMTSYSLRGNKLFSDKVGRDRYLAATAFDEFLFPLSADVMGASLFGYLYKSFAIDAFLENERHPGYPKGTPSVEGYTPYLNEAIYAGVYREISAMAQSGRRFFAYFHLFSPHFPYKPGLRFWRAFEEDGYVPLRKSIHPFGMNLSYEEIDDKRLSYDQQVAHVDAEFGRLIDYLEQDGILENSILLVTADHGEIFERGFYGHGGPILYEPVISIPLMLYVPGRTRGEVYSSPTCNIDVLPTVLSLVGEQAPASLDGRLLPGFGGVEEPDRAIVSIYAGQNSVYRPIRKANLAMRKGEHKIIAYLGYFDEGDRYEYYHLGDDPEETKDLAGDKPAQFNTLKEELLDLLASADKPYASG